MRILLAEDDPSIQLITRLTLEKVGGHFVFVVADGQSAVDQAVKENYDLIILDGMMPILDGFDTCRQLKKIEATQNIPVIFMTAKGQQSDVNEGLSAGAIGYIIKPFDASQLCREVDKIINKNTFNQGKAA